MTFKLFRDKEHAISTTSSMLMVLIQELNKNEPEDFEIWIAANHLKDILDKHQEKSYQEFMKERAAEKK
jgi:hypothetical protein